jgi:hypothetical protein
MTDDDREWLELIADELRAHAPMTVTFEPNSVFMLTGLVQLALRHPNVTGVSRDCGERFVASVRRYFADCPFTLEVVRRADDPAEDR